MGQRFRTCSPLARAQWGAQCPPPPRPSLPLKSNTFKVESQSFRQFGLVCGRVVPSLGAPTQTQAGTETTWGGFFVLRSSKPGTALSRACGLWGTFLTQIT